MSGVADYPPGQYTPILIEPYWPHGASSEAADASSRNRATIKSEYENYQAALRTTREGPLAQQEGAAAEAASEAFLRGEVQAGSIAEKNEAKSGAYATAVTAFEHLRSSLRQIAAVGNKDIDEAVNSKDFVSKVGKIAAAIETAQQDSSRATIQSVDQIKGAMQTILIAQGDDRSPDQWAADNGISLTPPPPPSRDAIEQQVKSLLEKPAVPGASPSSTQDASATPNGAVPGARPTSAASVTDKPTANLFTSETNGDPVPGATTGTGTSGGGPSSMQNVAGSPGQQLPGTGGALPTPAPTPGAAGVMGGMPGTSASAAGFGGAGGSGAGSGLGSVSSAASGGGSAGSLSSAATSNLTPEGLAQSFNNGVQTGGPMSSAAEGLSQGISQAAQGPTAPVHDFASAPAPISPSTSPTSGGHYNFDSAQQYSQPATPAYTPTDTGAQMYAAPAAPMAGPAPVGGAMPSVPAGPLPTYGSDLRPPMSAAAPAPMAPAVASPLSAPVNPASGQSALAQPAVVKQAPVAPAAPVGSAAGLTENAVAATAAGAVAGAASQRTVAQGRLQKLVDFVARQEPKLSWIVGDREDGTTVLATDLASGWIPPHIQIPSGVQLLEPARRRGSLGHLLGETTETATWTPGHYLPPEKDVDPLATSFRSRQVPDIDDLNWELSQATNWRDGLPRLAHTLAKAGAAGTGVLDSEADMLHQHLDATARKVLATYPDGVDAAEVGNWQLLAAIDALLAKQQTNLKYHFAWFQVLNMATQGGSR
jgi:hypothetical protein